jgi:hypothetical protein
MTPRTKRMVAIMGLIGAAMTVTGAPPAVDAGGATLYELTENMKLVQRQPRHRPPVGRRIATSAITGVAAPGTPLCPVSEFESGPAGCAVNVLGSDNISLTTGLGTINGDFTTVIQGDNPVDGPEAVVLKGEFRGQMNFSPAIVGKLTNTPLGSILLPHPYGTVAGTVAAQRGRKANFTGVFRLPFAGNTEIVPGTGVTLRQVFCPATPLPNQAAEFYDDIDLAYLDNVEAAGTPEGRCLDIQPNELSLGAPLVRFDVQF